MTKSHPYNFYKYRCININDVVVTSRMLRRRLNILKKWSESFKDFYPNDVYKGTYWNFKIPILDSILNKDTTFEIRRECIQYLVDAVCHMLITKVYNNITTPSKIMCLIDVPRMFSSEVTLFVDKEYYEKFFIRNSKKHKLILITDTNRSLIKEFNIKISDTVVLQEQGYIETINDEDTKYQGELWSIGQLDSW